MLKRFFARNRLLYGSKFGGVLDRRPPHSEFEGTKPSKGTVSIGTRLLSHKACKSTKMSTCGLAVETEKRITGGSLGEESHKTVIFYHHVEAPFRNRSVLNLVSL